MRVDTVTVFVRSLSMNIVTEAPTSDNSTLVAAVGGAVGGLVFLLIIAIVIVIVIIVVVTNRLGLNHLIK